MSYTDKNLNDWNVKDFHDYMGDKHKEMFGIAYQPFINWGAEKGLLGTFVGTARKKGEVSKEVAKRFIDIIFAEHKPTPRYPGVSFGSNYTHRKYLIQRAEMEIHNEQQKVVKKEQEQKINYDDLSNLL